MTSGASRPRTLRVNVGIGASSSLVRGALAFATSLVVARAMTVSGRGTFSFVTTGTTMIVMLAGLGLPSALTRAKAKDDVATDDLYRATWLISGGAGLCGGALFVLLFWSTRDSLFAGVTTQQAGAVALLTPPMLLLSHWTVVAYLEDRVKQFALTGVASGVLFLLACSALAAGPGLTPTRAIGAWAATTLLPCLTVLRWSRVRGAWRNRGLARGLLSFGVRANVASMSLILAWRLDVFLVKGFRGLAELGVYAVAVGVAEILLAVAVSLRIGLTPMQGQSENRSGLVPVISTVTRLSLWAGTAVAALGAFLAQPLVIGLYGDRYAAAAGALRWLLPGVVALIVQGPLIDFLLTEGQVRAVTVAAVTALALNVVMNVLLLPRQGLIAAAESSAATYALSCGLCLWHFRQQTGSSWRDLLVVSAADLRQLRRKA